MVEKKVAFVFPGQGAHFVGMGQDLYETSPAARSVFEKADAVLGFPLSEVCFKGPEEKLRQTQIAQPAILTMSLACLEAAKEAGKLAEVRPSFVAGHSLGEYTSLVAAGVLDLAEAVHLVRQRGCLMEEAGLENPGSMLAIIGLDLEAVEEICRLSGSQIANINCPGQVVISGDHRSLERAKELAKEKGARHVMPLNVCGAFHTPLMLKAAKGLAKVLGRLKFRRASVPIVANTTASPLTSGRALKKELRYHLCHCVQWQQSVEFMTQEGVSMFIEMGPGQVLSRLIQRTTPGVSTLNLGDAKSIKVMSLGLI